MMILFFSFIGFIENIETLLFFKMGILIMFSYVKQFHVKDWTVYHNNLFTQQH